MGVWDAVTVIELDDKGRVLLPASVRRKVRSRRFQVQLRGERIELLPIESLKTLKGKYKNRFKTSWDTLEERAERPVKWGKAFSMIFK